MSKALRYQKLCDGLWERVGGWTKVLHPATARRGSNLHAPLRSFLVLPYIYVSGIFLKSFPVYALACFPKDFSDRHFPECFLEHTFEYFLILHMSVDGLKARFMTSYLYTMIISSVLIVMGHTVL